MHRKFPFFIISSMTVILLLSASLFLFSLFHGAGLIRISLDSLHFNLSSLLFFLHGQFIQKKWVIRKWSLGFVIVRTQILREEKVDEEKEVNRSIDQCPSESFDHRITRRDNCTMIYREWLKQFTVRMRVRIYPIQNKRENDYRPFEQLRVNYTERIMNRDD